MTTLMPIPLLAEQHRIVTKVDELLVFCDQLQTKRTTTCHLADTSTEQAVAQEPLQ